MHKLVPSLLAFVCFASTAAGLKEYLGDLELLAPEKERRIVGTWLKDELLGHRCTRSIEEARSSFYEVTRCDDGGGGKHGERIQRVSATRYHRIDNTAGDYYVIMKNGDLELRDTHGRIGVEPRYGALWPSKPSVRHN
ncbi:hypothetical protein LJR175_008368 [Variovorax sp. LjRoot175]|uniref:hypothetical protein n=1 Tax=Variovorax sp. LjRoot175 TaxID=3342276 RepID=UPI003ED07824